MSTENDRIVRHIGSDSTGKAIIAVTGPGESFVADLLKSLADTDRDIALAAIDRAEKVRDDHYAARGELRAQITVLIDHVLRLIGE